MRTEGRNAVRGCNFRIRSEVYSACGATLRERGRLREARPFVVLGLNFLNQTRLLQALGANADLDRRAVRAGNPGGLQVGQPAALSARSPQRPGAGVDVPDVLPELRTLTTHSANICHLLPLGSTEPAAPRSRRRHKPAAFGPEW